MAGGQRRVSGGFAFDDREHGGTLGALGTQEGDWVIGLTHNLKGNQFCFIVHFSRAQFWIGRRRPTRLALLFEVGDWPPHDGFRRMGRFNLWSVLADDGRQGLRTLRTHLTHRPREDSFLPEQKLAEPLISAADRSCGLRYDRGHTVAPAELGAVNPHAV